MSSDDDKKKTLTDDQITTDHKPQATGRRGFLGLMAAGGAAGVTASLAPTPAEAQGTDADNGNWTDRAGCGRGYGGAYSGYTDADNGNITDRAGYGRGAPYC
ncbi:twin-arginine translocation signal domain-containing protein [Roseibacterium beibuensis]|uniref:Twin-arginine translocation signal domain-containing protein n=1 Tax=[Roseibacterium] beibuensis TaxID=1193142 RepID=A0ABP9LPE3_9RHOB|nr:twin-arginine translocation signal domain-containing protein [Roseibacterium beibuensis]MCS6626066.1 twin-arginine translocation signal domain-containing protein [Roseibacterium beibuensis]